MVPNSTYGLIFFRCLSLLGIIHHMVYKRAAVFAAIFCHLIPLSASWFHLLQYWHAAHVMIWEWRLIMSLSLKSRPSKILRHLVTRKTINFKNTSCKKHNLTSSSFCSFKATNFTSCEHRHALLHLGVQTHWTNTSRQNMRLQKIDSKVKQNKIMYTTWGFFSQNNKNFTSHEIIHQRLPFILDD